MVARTTGQRLWMMFMVALLLASMVPSAPVQAGPIPKIVRTHGAQATGVREYAGARPGWRLVTAEPVAPEEALRALFTQERVEATAPAGPAQLSTSEAEVTPEVQALARALENDPRLIFDYVHNHIEYVPTFGSANGATGTLLAGRGNDCDQASLFIALMRAAGYTANYVVGIVEYEVSHLAQWLGVDEDIGLVVLLLGNGGIPVGLGSSPSRLRVMRVWAEAVIDGQTYPFDPAMKAYEEVPGIDLATAMGYDRDAFLAHAIAGAEVTDDSIRNVNEANVRADLAAYSMNLVNHIRDAMPEASVAQVIGGRSIIATEMSEYPTSLPDAVAIVDEVAYTEIPQAFRHTLRVQHVGIDYTFNTFQIAGKRVSIFYREDNHAPELRVDGVVVATGNSTVPGNRYELTITVDHPYAAGGGTFADQQRTFLPQSGGSYVIAHSFSSVSSRLIARRIRLLSRYRHEGLEDTSEPVLGESLWLIGLIWLHEVNLFDELVDRLGKTVTMRHHRIGLMGQEEGYFIDMAMCLVSIAGAESTSDIHAAFRAQTMMGSAFEHGVLEQAQGSDNPAVSTVKLLQLNNSRGDRTFLASADNWAAVRPQLRNYSASLLNQIAAGINAGHQFVLPENARIRLNQWRGVGFIDFYQSGTASSMGMFISGGYQGGYGSWTRSLSPERTKHGVTPYDWSPDRLAEADTPESDDPVDLATGNYVYASTDLSLGLSNPFGLHFRRFYNSGTHFDSGPLGHGWAHNYQISVTRYSHGDPALGRRAPVDAAASIVCTYVILDLVKEPPALTVWGPAILVTKWAMDQFLDNALTVHVGLRVEEFIRLADGTYNPPPGVVSHLSEQGDGYLLQRPVGTRYEFDAEGRISCWQDHNGNDLIFTYDAEGRLQSVDNGLGWSLTFAYTDGLLASVTDMAGRSVSYDYSDGNLTAFHDAEGNVWRYEYDALDRLTALYSPKDPAQALITNVYDEWDRVTGQTDALGNVYAFYYSPFRTVQENPDGSRMVHYFDEQGRHIIRQDALGHRVHMAYDGQWRMRAMTDRLGDTIALTYHQPTGMLASYTDAEGDTTTYTYTPRAQAGGGSRASDFTLYNLTRIDYPDGTHEEFTYDDRGNVTTYTDRAGNQWTYAYNGRGQKVCITNPEGGVTTYTYNPDGTLASSTDSDTGTVTYQYDAHKRLVRINFPDGTSYQLTYNANDLITRVIDQRGVVYQFEYDANSNLTRITRAFGTPIAQTIRYEYDAMNRLTRFVDSRGNGIQYDYTYWGGLTRKAYADGTQKNIHYDPRRWLSEVVDESNKTWRVDRDEESVIRSFITPTGRTISLSTDRLGYIIGITDPLNNTVKIARDAMKRIVRITDRLNREITIGRDNEGRVISISMPVIGTVTYARNALGLITRITDQRGSHWDFGYTPMGRLNLTRDPLGHEWHRTYDSMGRLSQITYPDGVTETRTYDGSGNLIRRQFSDGLTIAYTYDELDRLTGTSSVPVNISYGGEDLITNTRMNGANFGATYNNRNRLESVSYDGRMTVTYTYDARGLISQVTDDLTNSWVRFTYDDDRLLVRVERSNNITTEIERDANGRITRIKHGNKGEMEFTINAEDEITRIMENLPLDVVSFLAQELRQYAYDAANQITAAGFSYDARGRRTADPERTYTWDSANRLTGITYGSTHIAYEYTALGEVARRVVDGVITEYFYNYAVKDHPIMAEKRNGDYIRFYVYTPNGRLLYFVDVPSAAAYFYHFNHIGTTLFLTDAAGNITDSYGYTLYGQLIRHVGTSDQPFTYIGRYGVRQEGDTGLYQMRARYYDSLTARFISRDPIWPDLWDPKAVNPYQYVAQNPLIFIDPSGLDYHWDDEILGPVDDRYGTMATAPVWMIQGDVWAMLAIEHQLAALYGGARDSCRKKLDEVEELIPLWKVVGEEIYRVTIEHRQPLKQIKKEKGEKTPVGAAQDVYSESKEEADGSPPVSNTSSETGRCGGKSSLLDLGQGERCTDVIFLILMLIWGWVFYRKVLSRSFRG